MENDNAMDLDDLTNIINAIKIIVETAPIVLGALAVLVFIVTAPLTIKNPVPNLTTQQNNTNTANFTVRFQAFTLYNSVSIIFTIILILVLVSIFVFSLSYLYDGSIKILFLSISLFASINSMLVGVIYSIFFLSNHIFGDALEVVAVLLFMSLFYRISTKMFKTYYDRSSFIKVAFLLIFSVTAFVEFIELSAMPV